MCLKFNELITNIKQLEALSFPNREIYVYKKLSVKGMFIGWDFKVKKDWIYERDLMSVHYNKYGFKWKVGLNKALGNSKFSGFHVFWNYKDCEESTYIGKIFKLKAKMCNFIGCDEKEAIFRKLELEQEEYDKVINEKLS